MKKRIQIQGFLIFVATVSVVLFHKHIFQDRSERALNTVLGILGALFFFCGYFLRVAARGDKSEQNPDGKTLVSRGLYAVTRNPMYLGTLLIGLGINFILFKWWVGIVFLVVYLAIYIPQIDREEQKLSALFGEAFRSYCVKTPKFFPNIFRISLRAFEVKPQWFRTESYSFMAVLICIIAIKILAGLLG